MPDRSPKELRRHYLYSLLEGIRITWPVLSSLLVLQAVLGAIVGLVEGWGIGKGVYFAFITGLTIGYGDYVPTRPLTQILAVVIGFSGIALGGLVAALAVKSFQRSKLRQSSGIRCFRRRSGGGSSGRACRKWAALSSPRGQ